MKDERSRKQLVLALAIFTVIGTGLGVTGYLQGNPASDNSRFYMKSDGGAVLFEHARHGEDIGGCVDCHHELAVDVIGCAECHDDPDYTSDSADHDELLEIHERACESCHEIGPAEDAASCRDCHEEDLAAVYHKSCSACHLATAPERFADEAGGPLCKLCHLR
jgi:Class III cytochrome C family